MYLTLGALVFIAALLGVYAGKKYWSSRPSAQSIDEMAGQSATIEERLSQLGTPQTAASKEALDQRRRQIQ